MKILVIARGFPRPNNNMMGLFERDQAVALVAAGHEVAYAVADTRSIRRRRPLGLNQYEEGGIKVFEMNWPIGPMPMMLKDFVRRKALGMLHEPILNSFGVPDVVHAHFLSGAVASLDLVARLGRPFVVTEHFSKMNSREIDRHIKNRAIRAYSTCSQLVCVSESLAENIALQVGFESVVIPNVVCMPDIDPIESVAQQSCSFRFISAGNLVEGKGFDLLIEAFGEMAKSFGHVHLTIMGDGPEMSMLKSLAAKLDVADRISFFGRYERSDFAKELARSDAFVLASRSETFGVVYAEALSMGVPVIVTACGGPEDYVNAECGLVIPVDNRSRLIDAMRFMVDNRGDYNSVAIADKARRMFSPSAVAERLTALYERIA